MDEAERPLIIKKIKKAGHGHHGGAWKVAFADFATAMMAFFLLLWLLSAATPEQKQAISGFFDAEAQIGIGEGAGFSDSMIDLGGAGDTSKGSEGEDWQDGSGSGQSTQEMEEEARQMEELLEILKQAIEKKEELKAFKDQLKLSVTPEGLRIQIVDKENRPMFESGKAVMRDHATKILQEIAPIISKAGNRISLTGHTDAVSFVRKDGYSNWELSADRANAARRALINAGMSASKVGRVVGLADASLYNPDNPLDPINRRISIVVMNKATDEAIGKEDGAFKVDADTAKDLDFNSPPNKPPTPLNLPGGNSLAGIPESVLIDVNAIKGDNILVDILKAPEPSAAPVISQQRINLPDISLSKLNKIAQEVVPTPEVESRPPASSRPPVIKIDLGASLVPAKSKASVVPKIVLVAEPKPEPRPKENRLIAGQPVITAVTPGAIPLSLPGL